MAPKRKGKKLANNPARGFATVSTASKAKTLDENVTEHVVPQSVPDQHDVTQDPKESKVPVVKELHQLSPEELERQLEESDLNLFLEKHGQKVKRDVSRQINKLQTEKRLIRAQAEALQIHSWLSPEIIGLTVEAMETEQLELNDVSDLPGDDLTLKIWTLQQVLVQLGFPYNLCKECLQHLLFVMQDAAMREQLEGKDTIWGLDCSLDWLALHCKPQQIPSYTRKDTETVHGSEMQQWNDLKLGSGKPFLPIPPSLFFY